MSVKSKKPADGQLTAVAYYRYSEGGNQTEQSIEGQRRSCESYAAAHGLILVGEYVDRHISGTSDDRPNFQRLIRDSATGRFQAVIVYKTDRFARNRYDSAIYKSQLRKNGVSIFYSAESIPDGPEGIILESLLEGMAEYYSAELSQKIRRGMIESAHKCQAMGGTPPYGFKIVNHKFVPNPAEVPIVKKIFADYASGVTAADIAADLNAQGITTRRGSKWNKNSFRIMLNSEKYIGVYESHGVRVEDAIEPIIDKETFYRAKRKLAANQGAPSRSKAIIPYLLSGKVICGECGGPVNGSSGTGHGGFYNYYACKRQRTGQCNLHAVRKDWLEDTVVRVTAEFISQPERIQQIITACLEVQKKDLAASESSQILELKAAQKEAKRKQQNIIAAIEDGGAGAAVLMPRLDQLEAEIRRLQYQIDGLKEPKPQVTAEQLEFMLMQFQRMPSEQDLDYKRRLLDTFVAEVVLSSDKLLIRYNLLDNKRSEAETSLLELIRQSDGSLLAHYGGDDGNRTRVRKEVRESISGCSLPTTFPPRQADKQADALVASWGHGRPQSLGLLTFSA